MPIYEYMCKTCDTKFEELVRDREASTTARCPKCGAPEVNRLLSLSATNNGSNPAFAASNSTGHACGCGSCSCGSH